MDEQRTSSSKPDSRPLPCFVPIAFAKEENVGKPQSTLVVSKDCPYILYPVTRHQPPPHGRSHASGGPHQGPRGAQRRGRWRSGEGRGRSPCTLRDPPHALSRRAAPNQSSPCPDPRAMCVRGGNGALLPFWDPKWRPRFYISSKSHREAI